MNNVIFGCLVACFAALSASIVSANEPAVWIDVRTVSEYQSGHLPSAINIPHEQIEAHISLLALDNNHPIYLYCRSGRRSGLAKEALEELGYSRVENAGGYEYLQTQFNEIVAAENAK